MTQPLTGPHIQAKGYRKGRNFRESSRVNWLGVHTAEGGTSATGLGNYFRNNGNGSSNAGIGQDGGYCSYVNYGDTPYTNPPLNEEADTIELLGFAKWTREDWLARPAMLETFAAWLAWRAAVRGIPLVLLSAADIRAGKSGIVMHRTVNEVYKKSSHWDPGYGLPWDIVLPMAQKGGGVPVQANPVPFTPDWATYYNGPFSIAYITATQEKLNRLGYALKVDGIRGPATQDAIKNFQSKNGLVVDASPGPATQARLDARLAHPAAPAAPAAPMAPAGPAKIDEDGKWGAGTTKRLQQFFGTSQDGVISHQWKSAANENIYSAQFDATKKGSDLARAIQTRLGIKADGLLGPGSITSLQKRMGTHVDGVVSPESDMVREMQRRLNANTF